ncbi:MAG: shikimate kinase [Alphaproteobacteria bacterium CG_4_9_14_3_um_filter_47_13]|nr:MAG: shikimate kinase [Alphaproteobacteria bacterium CG_4_9_14_3_um_filter_47_13]
MSSIDEDMVDEIRRLLDRPILLVGLMGAGKTRMGREIAKVLNLPFTDSDDEIEKAACMEIAEIFEKFGEPYFRDGERRVVSRLLEQGLAVIATGGGAVMMPETEEAIRNKTLSIWVRAEMAVMVERTSRRDNRPLLQKGDPEKILTELAAKRYVIYEKSDIVIDSHNGPAEAILNQALEKIRNFLRYEKRRAG